MNNYRVWIPIGVVWWALGCAGAEEAARVELPVLVNPDGMVSVRTDLGYQVELSEARLVIDSLQFTVAGEASTASLWQRLADAVLPPAEAHPGHFEGGDVTGELPGHHVLDLLARGGASIGTATLIVGAYKSGNFTLGRAEAADGLPDRDRLLGHTAMFIGQALKAGSTVPFSALLDAPPGRRLSVRPLRWMSRHRAPGAWV